MTRQIAIIGAGMAGLAAARRLIAAGFQVTLFDKSRGLGGRMATRRSGDLQFDHGAQYFTAKGPRFQALVREWCAAGAAAPWFDRAFVGTPGMSTPARSMAEGANVVTGAPVAALARTQAGWQVRDAQGPLATPANGLFSAVILALPAPQIVPILATTDVSFPQLPQVVYGPCWAMMMAFGHALDLPADHLRLEQGPIAWVARNSSKPGRAGRETLVVHAAPDRSRKHLECTPDEIIPMLREHLRHVVGILPEPDHLTAHRWRYALVEQAADVPCCWDDTARIGACGDWCLGPRVEAAFDSGEAIAERIIAAR